MSSLLDFKENSKVTYIIRVHGVDVEIKPIMKVSSNSLLCSKVLR